MFNQTRKTIRFSVLSSLIKNNVRLSNLVSKRNFKVVRNNEITRDLMKNKNTNETFSKKFYFKIFGATIVVVPPVIFSSWYYLFATEKQRECLRDVSSQMPKVIENASDQRCARSLWTGMAISVDYKWSLQGLDDDSDEYRDIQSQVHLRSAGRILDCCLANSGLYVKFGQGLVAMNHILPKEYTGTLKVLQDKCLRRQSADEMDKMFIKDLGSPPGELFLSFDPNSIAAASLAEVFKATTHDGQEVAVKVQYSDLREKFDSDVATFAIILDLIEVMHPRFSFKWLLDELKETMSRELDFEAEGMNSEKCKKDLEHLKFIYVPDVLWGLTSKRILTTEFIDGIKISEVEDLKKKGLNLNRIGEDLLYAFAEQVFHTGFVHADPHPGNILVRKNQYTKDAQLVLLDHGLYETLPTEIRQPLARVWQAVVENDSDAMKKYSSLLGINDYRLFCMTLTQRWVGAAPGEDDFLSTFFESRGGVKGFTRKDFKKLPEDEKVKFRAAFRDIHDKVFDVFQNIPPRLVLVFRNLNIIRSIIKDHQSGVDRHQIMARSAVRGFFFKEGDTIFNHTKGFLYLFMFDMRLLYDWTKIKFAKIGMKMLVMVGFIPSLEEMRESIPQDIENV